MNENNLELWRILKDEVLKRDEYICQECGIKVVREPPITRPNFATVDHIIPWRLNGRRFDWENLQTLCKKCHDKKSKIDLIVVSMAQTPWHSYTDAFFNMICEEMRK